MKTGTLTVIVCIMAIAGAIAYWVVFQRAGSGSAEASLSRTGTRSEYPVHANSRLDADVTELATQRALVEASPVDLVDLVTSTRKLDADLMLRADAGDLEAMHALKVIGGRCAPIWPTQKDWRFNIEYDFVNANLPPGSPERVERERALAVMRAYCDRPYAPGELLERRKRFNQQLTIAAGNGDAVAQASLLFEGQTEDEIIAAFKQTDHPWVAEAALSALARNNGPIGREIEQAAFPATLLQDRQQVELIKASASQWLGCQRGRPCGPGRYDYVSQCFFAVSTCERMSVTDHIRHQQLSDYQFELMRRYLAAVESRLGRRG